MHTEIKYQNKPDVLNKDQTDLLFQACECCMPRVKDGWIDGKGGIIRIIELWNYGIIRLLSY